MYITEIEITDIRSFKGTHRVSLARKDGSYAGWTVFAGRNGAGKSTILKAMALAVIGPSASKSLSVFAGWVAHDATTALAATLLSLDPTQDIFKSGGRTTKTPFWTGIRWTHTSTHDPVEVWTDKDSASKKKRERGPWAENPSGWFIAAYGPYRHLGPPSAEVLRVSANPVLARLVNLFHEAATLSEAVEWLKDKHLRALEHRPGADDIKNAVLAILGDGLLPDGSSVQKVDSEGLWIERNGMSIPLKQVSDGYKSVTALVTDIIMRLHECYGALDIATDADGKYVCRHAGVILIDEIDAHLHVSWQQRIGFWLTRTFPNIQFLVTTHSPFICQAASSNGIIRLPAPGEDGTIEHISESTWNAVVNGGADDAVMTELFGMEHAHSKGAELMRQEVAALEAKVLVGSASADEIEEYEALRARLSDDIGELAERKLRSLLGSRT